VTCEVAPSPAILQRTTCRAGWGDRSHLEGDYDVDALWANLHVVDMIAHRPTPRPGREDCTRLQVAHDWRLPCHLMLAPSMPLAGALDGLEGNDGRSHAFQVPQIGVRGSFAGRWDDLQGRSRVDAFGMEIGRRPMSEIVLHGRKVVGFLEAPRRDRMKEPG